MVSEHNKAAPDPGPPAGSAVKRTAGRAGWPNYRSPHRRRADAEAHADAAPPPAVVAHTLVPEAAVTTAQSQAELGALVDELRSAQCFGYDTEFIGEDSFYSRFCVIQVATREKITLIDVLAPGLDLMPFWELIADPAVEVIVHAGLQDLEPVQRLTGRPPASVFDTQIAAAFIGQPYPVSLSNLCLNLLGADLGKSSKFSQWDRRPLTETQKFYAANDVRYLLWLREEVGDRLATLGHSEKAAAEFVPFADPATYRADPLKMKLKAKGGGKLSRKEQALANALLRWRAREAEARDLPMRTLMDDQVLVDLAKHPVESVADVKAFKGMPWPVKRDYAEALVALTAEALSGPLPRRPRGYKPLSETAQARLDEAWRAAVACCEAASISPSMTLTKREMTALVRAEAAGKPAPDSRMTQGWRKELLAPVLGGLLGPTE
ncbi:MAG: HRDC domain-containing protein [Planctomycetota bacterium]